MTRFSMRFAAPAAALAASLVFAGVATADPQAPTTAMQAPLAASPSPEAERLGRHIAGSTLAHASEVKPFMDIAMAMATAQMKAMAEKRGGVTLQAYDRFGPWYGYFVDATAEEFHADRPQYERIIGHWLAEKYTVEELQAVADLCDSAAATEFYANMSSLMGGLHGKSAASPASSPEARAAIERFKTSEGGKAFLARSKSMGEAFTEATKQFIDPKSVNKRSTDDQAKILLDLLEKDPQTTDTLMDLTATWFPGAMRRWGEKAEAAEKARQAAIDAGAPPPPSSH